MSNIEHPNYYNQGNIECIDAIKASMTTEEFLGFCKGNCVKYLWRYQNKDGVDDLEKAGTYLKWMVEKLDTEGDADDISGPKMRFFLEDRELPFTIPTINVTLEALKRKLDKIVDDNMLRPYGREVKFDIDKNTVDFTFQVGWGCRDDINEVLDMLTENPYVKKHILTYSSLGENDYTIYLDIDIKAAKLINTIFEFLTKKGFSVL